MDNHKANTSKRKGKNSQAEAASTAKKVTDWIADQFTVTKQIKKRDKANTAAGKKAK